MSMNRGRGHGLTCLEFGRNDYSDVIVAAGPTGSTKESSENHNVGAVRTSIGSARLPSACDPARVANKVVQCRC